MRPTPPGWPRMASALFYEDAPAAIDWLCRAFGFEVRLRVDGDDGHVIHSELVFGDGLVMVSTDGQVAKRDKIPHCRSPKALGGQNTQAIMIYVDDVEAHCARVRAAGGVIAEEPALHDYGEDYWADRGYECIDPEGHHWWIYQRLRTGPA